MLSCYVQQQVTIILLLPKISAGCGPGPNILYVTLTLLFGAFNEFVHEIRKLLFDSFISTFFCRFTKISSINLTTNEQ